MTYRSLSMDFYSYKIKENNLECMFSKAVVNSNGPLPSASDIPIYCHLRRQPLSEDDFLEKPKGHKREDRTLKELWASLVAQMVKNLPAVQETQI